VHEPMVRVDVSPPLLRPEHLALACALTLLRVVKAPGLSVLAVPRSRLTHKPAIALQQRHAILRSGRVPVSMVVMCACIGLWSQEVAAFTSGISSVTVVSCFVLSPLFMCACVPRRCAHDPQVDGVEVVSHAIPSSGILYADVGMDLTGKTRTLSILRQKYIIHI
jgi:hypothetical protein